LSIKKKRTNRGVHNSLDAVFKSQSFNRSDNQVEPEEQIKRLYVRNSLGNSPQLMPDVEAMSSIFENRTNKDFNDYMDSELVKIEEIQ